jgi:DDE superfamily endonuclease
MLTPGRPDGSWRLLILDGHSTHISLELTSWAWAHKIIIMCLPAGVTAHLQPADAGVFGPMKKLFKGGLAEREESGLGYSKAQFAECAHLDHPKPR